MQPIISAGPNQNGFSASQNAALTSSAINNAATANRNAQVVAGSNVGGNTGVTTGGQKQLQSAIATGVGNNLSGNLNDIALQNAETGRQNFFGAESALSGVASQYNPAQYGGLANTAGQQAFSSQSVLQQMANQKQKEIVGTGVGLALDGATMGLGGFGNLDTTGGSSFGEQVGNFFTGAAGGTS